MPPMNLSIFWFKHFPLDLGKAEWQTDANIYSSGILGQAIDQNIFECPKPATSNNYVTTKKLPYLFLTDEAFALKPFML